MYLGVDGGGTKTAFTLIDKSGRIRASQCEESAYHVEIGLDGLRRTLHDGVSRLLAKAQLPAAAVDFAFFGVPAYGEDSALVNSLDELPSALFSKDSYRCDNDVVCGWAGALGCADGINIVAGTGSIAYGEWQNATARCGGWGEIIGDEGSAYWIARSALETFSRMSDGRLERGLLYELMRTEIDLQNDLDMCAVVFNQWGGSRKRIAQLSKLVVRAAQAGDPTAQNIFSDAASELAQIVDATRTKLGVGNDDDILVSYSGGVFNAEGYILNPLRDRLQALSPGYQLVAPKYGPAIGSVLYAAKLAGFEFSRQSLKHLKQQSIPRSAS